MVKNIKGSDMVHVSEDPGQTADDKGQIMQRPGWMPAMLPPQHFAAVTAVSCIKRIGTSMSEASIYLHPDSVETSLENVRLQTKVVKTLKVVSIGSNGWFRTHQSSNMRILEMPAPFMVSSKRKGPHQDF
ncbi:hypothetical protein SRHO_G00271680 [Serrasalmus rhombeus]